MSEAAPLLRVEAADFGYQGRPVVRGASLEVRAGELVLLVGANGSGKTTLLRGLLGFLQPLSGRVSRRGSLRLGYVPQRETLDPLYPLSALQVAKLGTWRDLPFWRFAGARERSRARDALRACHAEDLAQRRYSELSGGQRQRVLLARALATDPELLLLDEPTSGIDTETERSILELLRGLRDSRGLSVWIVAHREQALRDHANRTAIVADGRVRVEEVS